MAIYKTYIQNLTCTNCNKVIDQVEKNITKPPVYYKPWKVCKECKKISSEKKRQKMLENNPSKDPEIKRKGTEKWLQRYYNEPKLYQKYQEGFKRGGKKRRGKSYLPEYKRKEFSIRMKNNNPMFNVRTKEKMKKTIKFGLKKGIYPNLVRNGSESKNYKGNRNRSQEIRTRLYPYWQKKFLKKANYKCERCGNKNCRLEVHHESEKFKDCLNRILKYEFFYYNNLDEMPYSVFEKFINRVILEHENIKGRVLCVSCHKVEDKDRR